MTKRTAVILVLVICLLAAVPALAANVFKFADQTVTVYADETIQAALEQDGSFLEGTVAFKSANQKIFTVDGAGNVTGVAPGAANLIAELTQNGKVVRKATVKVNVLRRVTKVTLNTTNLQVFEPDDESILPLLKPIEDPENPGMTLPQTNRILVVAAGKGFRAAATITPADVRDKNFTVTSSDLGVLRVNGTTVTGMQPGECDLTIASRQDPDVTEVFHVLVTQPVKRLQITAPAKTVPAGGSLQLTAVVTPDNATIQNVEWSSRNEKAATVDANGVVTGLVKGTVTIEAKATDGSGVKAQIALTVIQDVTQVSITETNPTVATGNRIQLHATALPSNANDKRVVWTSSDESIATVRNGVVTGMKAGDCYITCTSQSNPAVSDSIPVHVIQMVTRINVLNPRGFSVKVGESAQLEWEVLPEDATIKDVTFRSRAPQVATVDANGIVTGLSKGPANIEINPTDGGKARTVFQVNVIQPVTGIEPMRDRYFAQLGGSRKVGANIHVLPRNANNQKILWSTGDPNVASVNMNNGVVTGHWAGTTTLTATSEDGGYTTSATLIVGDFDRMIVTGTPQVTNDNKIKLSFGNMSSEFIVTKIYFRVDCYDTMRNPMVCNTDGTSTYFSGYYPLEVYPSEWTQHLRFVFSDYVETGYLGYVVVRVTGFEFDNGQKWNIPEEKQEEYAVRSNDSSHIGEPTPTPIPTLAPPEPTPAPEGETDSGNG